MITSLQPNPVTLGIADPGLDIPINQWWGIKAGIGASESVQGSSIRLLDRVYRYGARLGLRDMGFASEQDVDDAMVELFGPDERKITAEQANESYGIDGALKFTEPTTDGDAQFRRDRTITRIQQQNWVDSARGGAFKSITGFGAMLAGQIFNSNGPFNVDFGLSVFPFFGIEKNAATIAAGAGWRSAIVLPAERLGIAARFPLFSAAVLNGATASSAMATINYIDKRFRDEETHFLKEVAIGTAFTGLFHLGISGVGKVFRFAGARLRRNTPESLDASERIAQQQGVEGAPVRATDHIITDENVIRDAALPDNALNAAELLFVARNHADQNSVEGKILQRLVQRFEAGERTVDVMERIAELTGNKYAPNKPTAADFQGSPEFDPAILETELKQIETVIVELRERIAKDPEHATAKAQLQGLEHRRSEITHALDAGKAKAPLTPEELAAHTTEIEARPQTQAAVEAVREQRVNDYAASQHPEAKAKAEATRAEADLAESRNATVDPMADRFKAAADDADKRAAIEEADATQLEADLRRELEGEGNDVYVQELEAQMSLAKELSDEFLKVQQTAFDCLLKNGINSN